MFGLTAQATVRCIAKVTEAYRGDRGSQRTFRRFAAQPYDDRIFRFVDDNTVPIWTIGGRQKIACVTSQYQKQLLAFCNGEIDLMVVRDKWDITCVSDTDDPVLIKTTDVLGVDLGIVNIATDSDGKSYTGEAIEKVRAHRVRRRAGLQRRATKPAKRRLRKLSATARASAASPGVRNAPLRSCARLDPPTPPTHSENRM
jgi:hypothetical protein